MKNDQQYIDAELLIGKYLTGEISVDELHLLETWRKKDAANEEIFNATKKAWMLVDDFKVYQDIDVNKEWDRQKDAAFKLRKGLRIGYLLKVAAVVIVLGLSAILVQKYIGDQETVKTKGIIAAVKLPDGSEVSINSHSKIKYDERFSDQQRRVKLDGEAYFSVKKDTTKPFIVETDRLIVEVLGTAFNVDENEVAKFTEVMVAEGIVKVTPKQNPEKEVILKKGETARFFDDTQQMKTYTAIDENNIAWKTGVLKFKNRKLSYIVRKLNKTYHANIVIESKIIEDCRMTSTFENQSLEELLNVINATLGVDVTYAKDRIILLGNGCE